MEHIPAGAQGSLFVDDFAVYCSGSSAFEAGRKIQAAIDAASNWAEPKGLGFLLRKLRPLGLLVPKREKRSQPSS